jgi:hypothetical protein
MTVQIYDSDIISDDYYGEGTFNLTPVYNMPNIPQNQYIDVVSGGKCTGRVLISIEYQGSPIGQHSSGQQQFGYDFNNQGGNNPNQGGWGNNTNQGSQGGWGDNVNQGGWGNNPNQGGNQGGWGNNPNQGGNQGGW